MRVPRFGFRILLLAICGSLLAGCVFPGSVETVVKIGLSAPFEGLHRDLGYEVLTAVRLAVRQRNESGGVGNRYLVEQVALNDFGEAGEAAQQAHEMAADPDIVGVLGGWSLQTADTAGPEYASAGLAFVTPGMTPEVLASEAARVAAQDGESGAAAVLHTSDPGDTALAQAFVEAFVRQGGQVVGVGTPAGDHWVQDLRLAGAGRVGVVFVAADALTAASWIVAIRDAGFEGTVVGGPALGTSIVLDVAGEASDGVLFVSPFPPPNQDPAFVDAYQDLAGGALPGPAASWAYDATNRLLDTIDRAAEGKEPSLRAAVQKAWTAQGGSPDKIHIYVIQSGNVYTPFLPH